MRSGSRCAGPSSPRDGATGASSRAWSADGVTDGSPSGLPWDGGGSGNGGRRGACAEAALGCSDRGPASHGGGPVVSGGAGRSAGACGTYGGASGMAVDACGGDSGRGGGGGRSGRID
ncbi:hypothetical protein [Nocardia tenerifensis]|uniref:hypothetical protein n=1 Tax=Nocardia tenerifensis TaxID=228006 RepID=UPI000592B96E|nr:hypothetical protein [Nocardia tenerifensis]